MNTLKPVRLKIAWQAWPKGHVFTAMPAVQAQHMIAAGQAEYVTDAAPVASPAEYVTTPLPSPADRMMRPAKHGKRERQRPSDAMI